MQAQLGAVEGAATQVVIALTALGYFPSIGLGIAGTTLVGQSIGAGSPEWAFRLGNIILRYIAGYMLLVTLLFLLFSQYMAEWFVPQSDPAALSMRALIVKLLFFAALYQIPDGFHLGSSFCLRGAKDVKVTGRIVAIASFLVFVPLTHTLTFNTKQAWLAGLPQLGMGVMGGWMALTCYMFLLGGLLYTRWRSRSWMRV
jgi:MATE family multidrug resistance protein